MEIVNRFLNFDKLMGAALVKIVYYLGLVGIVLGVVGAIFMSLMSIGIFGIGGFIGTLIAAPIGGLLAICFLRFACEIYIVIFRMGEDISAIRGSGGTLKPPGT